MRLQIEQRHLGRHVGVIVADRSGALGWSGPPNSAASLAETLAYSF